MRGFHGRRRLSPRRFRSPGLRLTLAVGAAVALGWLGPLAFRPDAGSRAVPRASAQAQHVPRALDITPLGTFGGPITAVAVDGTRVYAVCGTALEAYDGRDPANLVLQGSVMVPGADVGGTVVERVVAGGDRVAVLLSDKASVRPALLWRLFEVQPGRTPVYGGSYRLDSGPGSLFLDAAIEAGHLYSLAVSGLRVFNVRDAARPFEVFEEGSASAMAIQRGRLFLGVTRMNALGIEPTFVQRVEAYDIVNPAFPVLLAQQDVEGQFESILLYRDQLLAWTFDFSRAAKSRLTVLTADPPTLAPIGRLDDDIDVIRSYGRTVVGDFLAVLDPGIREGVYVSTFDLRSLPAALPRREGYRPKAGYGVTMTALGDSVLLADNERGLHTLSLDPTSGALTRRATVDALGAPYGLATDGRYVYSADGDGEVWVLEVPPSGEIEAIAHTRQGVPAGASSLPDLGASLAVAGDRLVVTRRAGWGGPESSATVLDVADPRQPRPLGQWIPEDDPALASVGASISLYGPLALESQGFPALETRWLVAGRPGLFDLDLADPSKPRAKRVYDPDCRAGDGRPDDVDGCYGRGLAVDRSGDRVFVARGAAGVQEFDLALDGPSDPVRTFATGGDPFDVAVNDRAVFVANGPSGLHIAVRGSSRTADLSGRFAAYRIWLEGDTAYVVGPALPPDPRSQPASVWAIDVADPRAPVIRGHVELATGREPAFDGEVPPHILLVGDLLLATIPSRAIAVYRLADGRALPATRLILPHLFVAR